MSEKNVHEVRTELLNGNASTTPVTLRFEHDENNLVKVLGLDEQGNHKFDVSFVIRKNDGGDECFVCLEPPCPPNRYVEVNPCPDGGGLAKPKPNENA